MALIPASGSTQVGIVITVNAAQAQAALGRVQQSLRGLTASVNASNLQFRQFDRILNYIAVGALAAAAKGFLTLAGNMERLQVQMGIFEKSGQEAAASLDQIVNLSKDAPFSIEALGNAFVKFKSAGIDPLVGDGRSGPLKTLADAVAAFGGSEQLFNRAAIAIQQMAGKGVISMEELRQQLGEAIPTAIKLMAEGLGVSVSQLITDVSRGRVEFERGFDALFRKFEEKYAGAGELLANTFFGSINRLKSAVAELAVVFNRQGGLDVFTGLIRLLTEQIQRLTQAMRDGALRDAIDATFGWLSDNAGGIAQFISVLQNFGTVLVNLSKIVAGLLGALPPEALAGGLIGYIFFGRAGLAIGGVLGGISGVIAKISEVLVSVVAAANSALSSLGIDVQSATFLGIVGWFLFGKTGLIASIGVSLIDNLIRYINSALANLAASVSGFIAQIKSQFEQGPIEAFFNTEEYMKKSSEAAKVAREAFLKEYTGKGKLFGDLETGIIGELRDLLVGVGQGANVSGDQVTNLADKLKKLTEDVKAGRIKFEGVFGQPDPIEGLNPTQIQAIERFASMQESLQARLQGARAGGNDVTQFIAGQYNRLREVEGVIGNLNERIAKLTASGNTKGAEELRKELTTITGQLGSFKAGLNELQAIENRKIFSKIAEDIQTLTTNLNDLQQDAIGDPLSRALGQVEKNFDSLQRKITDQKERLKELTSGSVEYELASTKIADIEKSFVEVKAQLIEKTTRLNELRRAETEILLEQNLVQAENLGIGKQLEKNFDGVGLAVQRVKEEYRSYYEQLDAQIRDLRRKRLDNELSADAEASAILRIEEVRRKLIDTEQNAVRLAIYNTSAVGELWKSVGDTIEESVGGALEALVTRTRSVKDVILQMYNEITRAAIRYLLTVAKQQIFGGTGTGASGPGLGFGIFNALSGAEASIQSGFSSLFAGAAPGFAGVGALPYAKGDAFRGKIKALNGRSGDMLRGPTLFGLGGEAGAEAIMPLARGSDGTLGVRSNGGSGNFSPTININAMDAQSVRTLFHREGSALVEALYNRMNLNRGFRT